MRKKAGPLAACTRRRGALETEQAWICYLYALRSLEPSLVQIIWAGIGPLTITALEWVGVALVPAVPLCRGERICQGGILTAIATAAAVAATGLSATGSRGAASLGVALALVSGMSISVNALLCKRLNERGEAGDASRCPVRWRRGRGARHRAVRARVRGMVRRHARRRGRRGTVLIVAPLYVNQLGISLASPMTVRVVHALGPVLVFLLQLAEGRLPSVGALCCLIAEVT